MMCLLLSLLIAIAATQSAVLDPSLYLLPSPPLISNEAPVWAQTRVTREADTHSQTDDLKITTTEQTESMESAETFWPSMRTSSYGLGGIHVPLTFSVSGTYGNGGYGSGVVGSGYGTGALGYRASIASAYGSISADEPAKFGKSALAGSSYGSYGGYPGVRLFGGGSKSGWSGWGNGKWGHYGKG